MFVKRKKDVENLREKVKFADDMIKNNPGLRNRVVILKNECESLYQSVVSKDVKEINRNMYYDYLTRKNVLDNM